MSSIKRLAALLALICFLPIQAFAQGIGTGGNNIPVGVLTQSAAATGFFRSFLSVNAGAGATTATSTYFAPVGTPTSSTTEAATMEVTVPVASTLKNLSCSDSAAPGTSNSDAFTVRTASALGGTMAATSVTCTISGSATNCSDATHTLSLAAGAVIDFVDTTSGTPSARTIACSYELDI